MTQAEKNLTKVLGCILRNENPHDCEKIDSQQLLACADKNSVLHLVYDKIANSQESYFKSKEMRNVFEEANQSYAWLEFSAAAEKAAVDILMLKGIWLKNFYPRSENRSMCDIDFLYKPEQAEVLETVLVSLGYRKKKVTTYHDGWFNPNNGVTFEAHRSINAIADEKNEYFAGIWDRTIALTDQKHIFHMTAEDMFIHLLLHTKTHFKTESATLRQIADIYVMLLCFGAEIRKSENVLNDLELRTFSDSVIKLSYYLFENKNSFDVNDESSELADFVFGNISFGNYNVTQAREAYNSSGSKIKSFFGMTFPERSRIYKCYPFIDRHRWLLPFGYIYRLFQVCGIRKNNAAKKLKVLSGITAESARQGELINEFFLKYGI